MNLGLLRRFARDAAPLAALLIAATILFETVFLVFVREVLSQALLDLARVWGRNELLRQVQMTMLGADLGTDFSATALMTIAFSHPLMYTFMWALALTLGTRFAAEVDRGTADLLLPLPVSRCGIYITQTAVLVTTLAAISLAPLAGAFLGSRWIMLREPLDLGRLALLVPNLFALNLAIAGLAMLCGSCFYRRGPAVGIVLGLLLTSFLLEFLAPFWAPARRLTVIGAIHYYRPLPVVRTGNLPLGDWGVLLTAGLAAWLLGLWRFARRDVPAA